MTHPAGLCSLGGLVGVPPPDPEAPGEAISPRLPPIAARGSTLCGTLNRPVSLKRPMQMRKQAFGPRLCEFVGAATDSGFRRQLQCTTWT